VVTIVFADLIGSTALHERLDAESARRLMDRYYRALHAAVEAHGGTVVKLLGDGVMAAFLFTHAKVRSVRSGCNHTSTRMIRRTRSHQRYPCRRRLLARLPGMRHSLHVLPDERPSPEQLAVLRAMTPQQRWVAASRLYWSARRLKTAFVRHRHPEWTEHEVDEHVRRAFLYARS